MSAPNLRRRRAPATRSNVYNHTNTTGFHFAARRRWRLLARLEGGRPAGLACSSLSSPSAARWRRPASVAHFSLDNDSTHSTLCHPTRAGSDSATSRRRAGRRRANFVSRRASEPAGSFGHRLSLAATVSCYRGARGARGRLVATDRTHLAPAASGRIAAAQRAARLSACHVHYSFSHVASRPAQAGPARPVRMSPARRAPA